MQLLYLEPAQIELDPQGVREQSGDITGLAQTIQEQGLLQPLAVVPIGAERYRVVYGGRRLGAALQLGLPSIPCIVLEAGDPHLLLRQMVENVQRRDLNDIEKARAFRRLRDQLTDIEATLSEGELDERIGQAVGIAPRTVRRYLGLLDLPEEVQQLIRDEALTVTQAQHLRRIPSSRSQIELARLAVDEGLSAADISNLANYFVANPHLSVDAAIAALQSGAELRTSAPTIAPVASPSGIPTPSATENDDDLWAADDDVSDLIEPDEQRFDRLEAAEPVSRAKSRVFRIRSLDQMVDETDRLARAYHEGDVGKWVQDDETAPVKLKLLLKQLRTLSAALETLANQQGWSLSEE